MLSRVAENLFWAGRYVERADSLVRLLDDAYNYELDAGLLGTADGPRSLTAVASLVGFPALPAGREAALDCLAFDASGPYSIRGMIAVARENARGSQEALSAEAWSQLNQLHLYLSSGRARARLQSSPFRFFERVRRECLLHAATVDGTLPRGDAYHFLLLGQWLERVDMTGRVLHARLADRDADSIDPAEWEGLLRIWSAKAAYVRRHVERVDTEGVVGFLLLDSEFPRAARFGVIGCLESLRAIATAAGDMSPNRTAPARTLGRLESELGFTLPGDLTGGGHSNLLVEVRDTCSHAGQEIHRTYFLNQPLMAQNDTCFSASTTRRS